MKKKNSSIALASIALIAAFIAVAFSSYNYGKQSAYWDGFNYAVKTLKPYTDYFESYYSPVDNHNIGFARVNGNTLEISGRGNLSNIAQWVTIDDTGKEKIEIIDIEDVNSISDTEFFHQFPNLHLVIIPHDNFDIIQGVFPEEVSILLSRCEP